MGGNTNSFEAGVISRARAEKQREAALRTMKQFRVVDHPPMKLPGRERLNERTTSNEGVQEQ